MIVLCSFISPFRAERRMVRELVGADEFVEVFVDTPIEECMRRDPKGLYARAKEGKIKNFTGIDSPYEAPENPEITVTPDGTRDVSARTMRRSAVLDALRQRARDHLATAADDLDPRSPARPSGRATRSRTG